MSFLRRKPKLTDIDEQVRAAKNEVANEMLAPLRKNTLEDDSSKREVMAKQRLEELNLQHACLSLIDDIITAKTKEGSKKEIPLYDNLIEDSFAFYNAKGTENLETKKAGIVEMIHKHIAKSNDSAKNKDRKSATMTSFKSAMATILKSQIHRDKSNTNEVVLKSKRSSLPIAIAQAQSEKLFDVKKLGQKESSDSDLSSEDTSLSDSRDKSSPKK